MTTLNDKIRSKDPLTYDQMTGLITMLGKQLSYKTSVKIYHKLMSLNLKTNPVYDNIHFPKSCLCSMDLRKASKKSIMFSILRG